MKKALLFITLVIIPFLVFSQEQYKIIFDEFQIVEDSSTSLNYQIKFPQTDKVVVMGGLNDLDGMNNYFNIFGGKLIVNQQGMNSDGSQSLILRKEDGSNFFDLFPTLRAKLIPLTSIEIDENLAD
jgi:hypothetical protein